MKIRAFHIKNYRSIVDSGTCYLSLDNITALIGQNESGKTSVLEALRSFYEGRITDDILRSDQTFPEITCVFELDETTLEQMIDFSKIPGELHSILKEKKEISLIRKWLNARKSTFGLAEPELQQFFESLLLKQEKADRLIKDTLLSLGNQQETLSAEYEITNNAVALSRNEVNKLYIRLEELGKLMNKTRQPDVKITAQIDIESCKQHYAEAGDRLREFLTKAEHQQAQMAQIAGNLERCRKYVSTAAGVYKLTDELQSVTAMLVEAEHQFEFCTSEKEARTISRRLEQIRSMYNQLTDELREQTAELQLQGKVTERVLAGQDQESAMHQAQLEIEQEHNYYSAEDLGGHLFKYLPVYEFFEDFSSLLPNKIDLEDLLNENKQAEGYKAARNFLYVAGLNADFFREKNHRILKQKIENLNTEITIDFQDYWHQQVGKNDKIKLNFELEHYDFTVPEKSGKPYLEFWIKDKQERLYPKQRSRGVRWFLSFYLELKATAKENHHDRVLLIDEPGLSLHARAQEDVLKVFEDLKGNLQIIYCTHSPHLIDLHKLYRIMAVQRVHDHDETSATIILDSRSLNTASSDTLSPVYSLMGTRLNDRQLIFPRNNIIVSDTATFYYIDTMARIFGYENLAHYIPSSGSEGISVIANLLFGWRIDFGLLTFDNSGNKEIREWLKSTIFANRDSDCEKKIREFCGFPEIEDLFSTIDFKRFIIKQRIGITESNTEHIEIKKLSRIILASDFCSTAQQDNLKKESFDVETQDNFEKLFTTIRSMVE
jgi:predicted ATP-dependent endonuclease of OLD family